MSAGESTGWGVVNRGYQPHTHTHIILTTCSSTHLVCQFSPTKKKSNCYLHCATIVHRTKRQVTHTHQNLEKKEQWTNSNRKQTKNTNTNRRIIETHRNTHTFTQTPWVIFWCAFFICIGVLCGYTSLVGPKDNM